MTWLQHHTESEQLAADAEIAARRGDAVRARDLYAQAAKAEEDALADLEPAKSRTFGISAVSAVSLYYKAARLQMAKCLARRWLDSRHLPKFAAEELGQLLLSIRSERAAQRSFDLLGRYIKELPEPIDRELMRLVLAEFSIRQSRYDLYQGVFEQACKMGLVSPTPNGCYTTEFYNRVEDLVFRWGDFFGGHRADQDGAQRS